MRNDLSSVQLFLGQFPLVTSDFQLPARNANIGTSLEWSGESHSEMFNDSARLRPCKVSGFLSLLHPYHYADFLIKFPSARETLVLTLSTFRKLVQRSGLGGRCGLSQAPPYQHLLYFKHYFGGPKSHTR